MNRHSGPWLGARFAIKAIADRRFRRIAQVERQFGTTIKKWQTIEDMASRGKEFVSDKPEELRRIAMWPDTFTKEMLFLREGEDWRVPVGAYKRCGGPT